MYGRPLGPFSVSCSPKVLMLSVAQADGTVAAPMPKTMAEAATAPASFVTFILTPLIRSDA